MNNLIERLSSRKLWLAIASFIVFAVNKQYTEALTVVLVYLGVNGAVSAVSASKPTSNSTLSLSSATALPSEDFSAIDHNGKIVSGRAIDENDEDWNRPA